ncbi:FAD-dependent oxidoreductase [Nocardia sp. ET3-3]|uniref:FAD-dependent oxidoreductase n=1 Tax=Nocardia terrae TaxID=2675851 RepID=A0A7K1V235_9NOCA|nr:FAD-dependent oxidoreductase [Nocardia terrae]MVU80700.1 FAD-dependent oxidoreductase [Nocardia terrae]
MNSLVVVGASLAGLKAVESARKAGFEGSVTLIGAEPHLPYDRPPLSKDFLDNAEPVVPYYRLRHEMADLGVTLRLGTPATGLDTDDRTVRVGRDVVEYDSLIIATGARASMVPGADGLGGVHTLRTLDDARAVRAALDAGARTVVIGAGFIGSEVASSARKRGLPVTLVEALPTPLVRAVGPVMGSACSSLHVANGADLRCGVAVSAIEGTGSVERVRLSDGSVIEADLVVIGVGAAPATDWLEGSGILVNNGVVCDSYLCTSAPGVYAAGDVARWYNSTFARLMRLEHWTSAQEQGAVAGRNAVDPTNAEPYSTVPYFWSDWYGSRIQFVGVPEGEDFEIFGSVREGRMLALYGNGDHVTGALALNRQPDIMKLRALIDRQTDWREAVAFAAKRATSWLGSPVQA